MPGSLLKRKRSMKGWRSEAFYAMKILLCFEEGVEQLIDHIKPCVTVDLLSVD